MPYRIGDGLEGTGQQRSGSTKPISERAEQGRAGQGTLLWIGDREATVYRDAYTYCDANVSQLAYRRTVGAAIERPATDLTTMILCRDNDSARDVDAFDALCRRHPTADAVLLVGPLCAGSRPAPSSRFGVPAIAWHQWRSKLTVRLDRCGLLRKHQAGPRSVAIIADRYDNASALLTIAESGGATAFWCRPQQLRTLRAIDEFWWDDSATLGKSWNRLLDRPGCRDARHVWISNCLMPQQKRAAVEAGIDEVIAKPGDYSRLLDRILPLAANRERTAA